MKTVVKIIILCVACVLAIGGVMIYAKTRVSPPESPKAIQQYSDNLNVALAQIPNISNRDQADAEFDNLVNRIEVFSSEKKLTPNERNEEVQKLLGNYAPKFLSTCFNAFEQSNWSVNDHNWMQRRINVLTDIKLADGSMALKKSTKDSLDKVNSIIADYNNAVRLCNNVYFSDWANARSTLSSASKYANDAYLSNNRQLKSRLNEVRGTLMDKCYSFYESKVNQLSNYSNVSQYTFEEVWVPNAESAIREYRTNSLDVFGYVKDADELESIKNKWYNQAMRYYDAY